MSLPAAFQEWWTAREIAAARLPDLPAAHRSVNDHIERLGWRDFKDHARRCRGAKGGGWEFHYRLFPQSAQAELLRRARAAEQTEPEPAPKAVGWPEYDRLTADAKAKAEARLKALEDFQEMLAGGWRRADAAVQAGKDHGVSDRTIFDWQELVLGVPREDWLPALAPRHQIAERKVKRVEISREFFDAFYALYMRQAGPSFADCYRKACAIAREQGWDVPNQKTLRRRFDAEVPRAEQVLKRQGVKEAQRLFPAQTRDKSHLHALEWVNADGHIFDVMAAWPDGTVGRPALCAYQDVHSGKILSWRVDQSLHSLMAMLALGDVLSEYGVPDHCLFDNGREFASKLLTGGTPNRFRFKVRQDDPQGVLTVRCQMI